SLLLGLCLLGQPDCAPARRVRDFRAKACGLRSREPGTCGTDRPAGSREKLRVTQEDLKPDPRGPAPLQGDIEMRRRTFDALATMAGFVLVAVLLVAGGLLVWGHSFVASEVHTQLAAQKIVFPPANSP